MIYCQKGRLIKVRKQCPAIHRKSHTINLPPYCLRNVNTFEGFFLALLEGSEKLQCYELSLWEICFSTLNWLSFWWICVCKRSKKVNILYDGICTCLLCVRWWNEISLLVTSFKWISLIVFHNWEFEFRKFHVKADDSRCITPPSGRIHPGCQWRFVHNNWQHAKVAVCYQARSFIQLFCE